LRHWRGDEILGKVSCQGGKIFREGEGDSGVGMGGGGKAKENEDTMLKIQLDRRKFHRDVS